MKRFSLFAVLCFSLALILSACGGKSDADVQKEVTSRVKTPGVTSTVKDGVVTLGGTVTTQMEKDQAVAAAKGEGVKSVTDNIQIKPMATPMPMPASTPMTSMSPGAMASPMKK
ncbi:MAG: BON domain-containing protein [Pyrinomonadaceae bacterium]